MADVKSVCAPSNKPLIQYELGERYSYINDRLMHSGVKYVRSEISEELAIVMTKTVGYHAEFGQDFGNKDYVCVAGYSDSLNEKRVFVYKHDFAYWLYIVWVE